MKLVKALGRGRHGVPSRRSLPSRGYESLEKPRARTCCATGGSIAAAPSRLGLLDAVVRHADADITKAEMNS